MIGKVSFFVLLDPQTDDFLYAVDGTDGTKLLEWTPFIIRAMQFPTLEEAREKAKELLSDREEGYSLAVCDVLFLDGTHLMWRKLELVRKGQEFVTNQINALNES